MGYKYFIDKTDNNGYTFALYPNNSNSQEIGISNDFKTYQEAKDKLEQFKTYVISNGSNLFDIIKIKEDRKYLFKLKQNTCGIEFYRQKGYYQLSGIKNGIKTILTNINAPLKQR